MLSNKQIDIFGNEVDFDTIQFYSPPNEGKTLKSAFRQKYGYKNGYFCKNCAYFEEHQYNRRKYFKCQKLGISSSSATDIRKKDVACNLYLESEVN